jgi:hypothetical protein
VPSGLKRISCISVAMQQMNQSSILRNHLLLTVHQFAYVEERNRGEQSRTGMQRELRQSGADKVEQDAPTHGRCWRCRDQRKQSNRKAKRGDQMGSAAAARSASPAAAIQTADRWVRSHKTKCSMAWIRHTRAEENGESEERRGGRKDEESHLTHLT